jgi:hypothetical protein
MTAGPELSKIGPPIARRRSSVLGAPLLFRGTPAASSPLRPVADLQYRRTERAHVEWLPAGTDRRSIGASAWQERLPLAVPVTVSDRTVDGFARLAADVNLAPLAAGGLSDRSHGVYQGKPFRSLTAIRVIPSAFPATTMDA